ncbi:putative carboxylic ester hydrolase [Rosa chinensis]|uniref:Phospholipase A1 n=1 Tax=Rosa chinensis TaxID=74649 RepID=A0A2P6PVR2_ROSCH|nr:phospholipase A1-IIgamma [Rosa chinensis]PRQ26014.1 putative carboxylic ester hydrolase [Rosa chinensis]
MTDFSKNWEKLSGDNLWSDLKDPLHVDLRRYIIHYGERAGAIDDVFIDGKLVSPINPKSIGYPRYARKDLFDKVGLVKGNYRPTYIVEKYVYGAPKLRSRPSYLLAYVAVSDNEGTKALGRRDILIAWRGTKLAAEVAVDKNTELRPAPKIVGNQYAGAMVHGGWYDYYTHADVRTPKNQRTSCQDQVGEAVRKLIDQYGNEGQELSITITGRGTGAAFAILNGMDIVCNKLNYPTKQPKNPCLVTAIVFGCPFVGNEAFKNAENDESMFQILRVTNEPDPVTNPEPSPEYEHIGVEVKINTVNSPYLKNPIDTVHELEVYLHGVAAHPGTTVALEDIRRTVMVNKTLDGLKDETIVPPIWILNKFMVQNERGAWELKDVPVDD